MLRLIGAHVRNRPGMNFRRCPAALGAVALLAFSSFVEPVTGLKFVLVPAGAFQMGSPTSEPGHRPDERLHTVRFSQPVYVATTEVTQRAWRAVMGTNPSHFRGDDLPVEEVSWNDVHTFIARLNARTGRHFRLPTEAEWEYGCRAGTRSAFSVGSHLTSDDANIDARYPLPGQPSGSYRGRTTSVASFAPNAWGIYDMHGNVWEWTEDEYCPYGSQCASGLKVIRGGSWYFNEDSARCALRYTHAPSLRGFSIGFRLVCDAK